VTPDLEKVYIYEILESYIKAWGNFGFTTFDILPIQREIADDTKVEVDKNLFYTMLDCIFINAHQHGFAKRYSEDNKLVIAVEGVTYKDEDFVRIGISNNGKPLPENFTVVDFSQRGVVGLNSSQDGIGGDHICKIAHKHNGYISIDSESEWLTFNVLIPVYTTSSKNFNDYEYESV
jgi:light-regulated signal transduction histidine kinase (bacteriophytochrome)